MKSIPETKLRGSLEDKACFFEHMMMGWSFLEEANLKYAFGFRLNSMLSTVESFPKAG